MRKRRFNHIEPREQGEGSPAQQGRNFRRTLERGLRIPAMLKAFVFRRRIEVRGRERGPDEVEAEVEELVASASLPKERPDPASQPSRLEVEEPTKPIEAEPPRFSRTKSHLEKLASEIKHYDPPVQARKSAGALKREELERLRRREAEIADLVHKENNYGKPSVKGGLGKLLMGGFLLCLIALPFLFTLGSRNGGFFRWLTSNGFEAFLYIFLAVVAALGEGARRRRRRRF